MDPLRNRPLGSDCDERGWKIARQTVITDGSSEVQKQCVREDTGLPLPSLVVTTE